MTAGWVATLYPEFTLCGKSIHRGHTQQIRGGENRIGSSKSDTLALEADTSFLRGPCGRSYPWLWRSIATYGSYGVFNWDARYDVRWIFGSCDVEFRVWERCVNQQCERDHNQIDRLFWPPSSVVLADEIDIVVREEHIANH
jgi:hypothetical protein